MRPSDRSDEELLAWINGILQRERRDQTYGTVTVHLEKGRVVRATVTATELPDRAPEPQS